MQLSPLILKQYFLISLSVKSAVPDAGSSEDLMKLLAETKANISTQIETAKNEENGRLWKVGLRLGVRPSDESGFTPYVIDAELLGFFEVHESIKESLITDLVTCNAPAILFGAAREIILTVTGRGPLPPYLLPSTTFIDASEENRRKAAAESKK
jgi:preprotein translocase subunit SecB